MSALGKEDYTHLDFGGIVAFLATILTKSLPFYRNHTLTFTPAENPFRGENDYSQWPQPLEL
ncbi:hypothetical protein ADICYQ_4997 [Cyclobacterium qasimii M12-11B]|uniref:Uncharacterized protein n=1 Tax=Cyclobacterium qasimii M12-11B TaxID=641524 RepID=S7V8R0_9BACT|nr:hypothetical protein ADICYQ_4997 [Cyclobacterium qasimii M12-11B]